MLPRYAIRAANLPIALPPIGVIIAQCEEQDYKCKGITIRTSTDSSICAWAKFGNHVRMGEARTQDYVAGLMNSTQDSARVIVPCVYLAFEIDHCGYIIMEYIDGSDCEDSESDVVKVANAVKQLISIRSPTDMPPGPVGGGCIPHRFFVDCLSAVQYGSVKYLEDHVNNILIAIEIKERLDFINEVEEGLSLCLDDIHPGNFRVNSKGQMVALDFGGTCFLPPSFQSFSFLAGSIFARKVSKVLNYPPSKNLRGMNRAGGRLVFGGLNTFRLPKPPAE